MILTLRSSGLEISSMPSLVKIISYMMSILKNSYSKEINTIFSFNYPLWQRHCLKGSHSSETIQRPILIMLLITLGVSLITQR